MSQAAVHFSVTERRKIHEALARYLDMNLLQRTRLIKAMGRDGFLWVFGYGSLMRDPHTKPDMQFSGFIPGYKRGAFFLDRHYRGQPEKLSVTMGIRSTGDPRDKLRGLVQGIRIDSNNGTNLALESIMAFAARESSENPIYTYQIMNVQTRFGKIKVAICGTDEKSKQFIAGRLTMQEAAAIIASSFGEPKASPRNTGLAYWRFVLDSTYKCGMEPEPHIKTLVSMANTYRPKLSEDLKSHLENLENIPERRNFDPRVFEIDPEAHTATPEEVAATLHLALEKLNRDGDFLSPQRLRRVRDNMKKIKETRHILRMH